MSIGHTFLAQLSKLSLNCCLAALVETDDAYILDADLPAKDNKAVTSTKTGTSTRLFTGNAAIDGAVVGLGVGVIGSLLVGKLLEEKNKCNPRGRRDTASTR
jgi:hypothetical protein